MTGGTTVPRKASRLGRTAETQDQLFTLGRKSNAAYKAARRIARFLSALDCNSPCHRPRLEAATIAALFLNSPPRCLEWCQHLLHNLLFGKDRANSTPTTASTLYSSTITATPPEEVSFIATIPNYIASGVTMAQYISPNATYVSAAQHSGAGVTSNAITGISIPSGDIIRCGEWNSVRWRNNHNHRFPFGYSAVRDDGPRNPAPAKAQQRICVFLAGATVTSVTCASTASNNQTCMAAWYTPGTLAGTLDQSTGQDQPNATNWSSAATTTLAGSSDLVVGGYNCGGNTSVTSTPTDGSTSRLSSSTDTAMNLQDRTAWGTVGPAVTGTFSPLGSYCTGAVVAPFK